MAYSHSSSATATINAPIAEVFALLNDLGRLSEWTPFAKMDKSMTWSIGELSTGVGAVYSWSGKRIGKGTQTITAITKPTEIHSRMTFGTKNFADTSYVLRAVGDATEVTWAMSGQRGLGDQIVASVLGLDKMMNKNFATGLADLKTLLESK